MVCLTFRSAATSVTISTLTSMCSNRWHRRKSIRSSTVFIRMTTAKILQATTARTLPTTLPTSPITSRSRRMSRTAGQEKTASGTTGATARRLRASISCRAMFPARRAYTGTSLMKTVCAATNSPEYSKTTERATTPEWANWFPAGSR